MAHDHAHGQDHGGHYIDQLCSVAVAGAMGVIGIVLYLNGSLTILASFFQQALLGGSILLVVLSVVRGVTLWREVGKQNAGNHHHHDHVHGPDCDHGHGHDHHHHDHGHVHGPGCSHDHSHEAKPGQTSLPLVASEPEKGHDHDHGHDHNHGWAPLKYAVLLLPITLFFLRVPNPEFNNAYYNCTIDRSQGSLPPLTAVWAGAKPEAIKRDLDIDQSKVEGTGVEAVGLGFKELSLAAADPSKRAFYEGKTGVLKGQFYATSDDRLFTLVRMKITCCGSDAVPINVAIQSPDPVSDVEARKWVEVRGVITFKKAANKAEYMPVIQLASREKGLTVGVPPDSNPFIY